MSLAYKLLYAVGFTPREEIAEPPHVREQFSALLDREEEGREPPYGPALDLGCGSGIWAAELARRGWLVTGVDVVPKALRRARERASQAGVEMRLLEGDVTRLSATGVGSGFPFLLDLGLFHDELSDEQRAAMGREVDRRRRTRGEPADGRVGTGKAWGVAAARREPRRRRGGLSRVATRNPSTSPGRCSFGWYRAPTPASTGFVASDEPQGSASPDRVG